MKNPQDIEEMWLRGILRDDEFFILFPTANLEPRTASWKSVRSMQLRMDQLILISSNIPENLIFVTDKISWMLVK